MIRLARIEDAPSLAALEKDSQNHRPWTLSMFHAALVDPLYVFLTDERGGAIAGFGCVKCAGDEGELDYIAVAESMRRQGVADGLLTALTAAVRAQGVQTIFLEVGVHNAPAVALYQKHGFTRLSVRKNYYGEGKDALVMRRDPDKSPTP